MVGLIILFAGDASSQQFTYDELIAGMRFERNRIATGTFRAVGTWQFLMGTEKKVVFDGPVELFVAFDFPNKKLRTDVKGVGFSNGKVVQDGFRIFCSHSDVAFRYSTLPGSKYPSLAIVSLKESGQSIFDGGLDIRSVGLASPQVLFSSRSFDTAYVDYKPGVENRQEIVALDKGIVLVTSKNEVNQDVSGFSEMSIDTNSGFTILRAVGGQRTGVGKDQKENSVVESNISWQRLQGVFVPSSFNCVSRNPVPGPPVSIEDVRISLKLDWESVNQPVDPGLFDYHKFELPKITPVVDRRKDPSPLIEVLGMEGTNDTIRVPDPASRTFYWIVAIGGGLLFGGCYWLYRAGFAKKREL